MKGSVLHTVDDRALAEAMLRVWGREAALKAGDNACTQAFMGNEDTALKWRRVMILIAAVSKSDADDQGSP